MFRRSSGLGPSRAPAVTGRSACFTVERVSGRTALEGFADAWTDLADKAVEPNPFYEPWMLLPALELGVDHPVEFLLVFQRDPSNSRSLPVLCGFLPVQRFAAFKGVPAAIFRVWKHPYSCLETPLFREGSAHDALEALMEWLAREAGCALLEFPILALEGPFYQVLTEVLARRYALTYVPEQNTRAMYRACADPDAYISAVLSGRTRKHLRRQRELLAESGALAYESLTEAGPRAGDWIREFLELEAAGWKGAIGSAMAAKGDHRRFFESVALAALERGRLHLSALRLDGRMIAARTVFQAGAGSYLLKIAYDEQYARFSPGTLLEMETINRPLPPGVEWTDSCTAALNPVYRRMWKERRTIQNLVVTTGRRPGEFMVSILPLLRWAKRLIRPAGQVGPPVDGNG